MVLLFISFCRRQVFVKKRFYIGAVRCFFNRRAELGSRDLFEHMLFIPRAHESVKFLLSHCLPQLPEENGADLINGVYIAVAGVFVKILIVTEINIFLLYGAVKRISACLNICLAFAGVQLIHKLTVHGKAFVKPRLAVLVVATTA